MKYTYNFFFIIYILLLIVGCDTISYYNSPGAAQVIGTKEKLYVFLQINRQRVSSLKYYDAPSVYPISNTAKLLEVNLDGTYSLKDIILPKKFNLNPNISHLFFYKNNIYFFADVGTRIGDELLLLKLKNELLCEVSIDNKELNTIINDERKRITYVQIDAFSMEQGALFVNVYRNIGEKSIFTWNKQQINISLGEEIDSFSFIIKIEPLLTAPIKVAIPRTPDWQTITPPSVTILDNDEPCDCYKEKLQNALDNIRDKKIPYHPLSDNSNATAHQIIEDSGFPRPVPPKGVWAPGHDVNLNR